MRMPGRMLNCNDPKTCQFVFHACGDLKKSKEDTVKAAIIHQDCC